MIEHNESADTAVAVTEGKNLFKANMEIQDLIPSNLGLRLVLLDQSSQTGIDFCGRNHSSVPADVTIRAIGAGIHPALSLIHRTKHQKEVQVLYQLSPSDKSIGFRMK